MLIISGNGKTRKLMEKVESALALEEFLFLLDGCVSGVKMRKDKIDEAFNIVKDNPNMNMIGSCFNILDLSATDILKNDYLKNIKVKDETIGNLSYSNNRVIGRGIIDSYSEAIRDMNTYQVSKNYFRSDHVLKFPALYDKNSSVCIMTVEPYEINTLDYYIKDAFGNVLICGCGLGYVTYMLALKDNVKSITILENNQNVIDLFQHQIYPQIPNNEKINIINDEALNYLYNNNLSCYDFIHVDLWFDVIDMVYPYLKCLMLEEKYPNTMFTYWIENTFYIYLQKELLSNILSISTQSTFDSSNFFLSPLTNHIINNSFDTINSQESLNRFLSINNLKNMLLDYSKNNFDNLEVLTTLTNSIRSEMISNIDFLHECKKLTR